jgi:hypothetical protein
METKRSAIRSIRYALFVFVAWLTLLAVATPAQVPPNNPGSIGIFFAQIYDPNPKGNHLGPLAVMHVVENSPAANAGIHCSDFVIAVNGAPVSGREFSEILEKDIHGPVGGSVRLTVNRFDGSQAEITLVRAPYPPHVPPATDPFTYNVPGNWSTDPRYIFPLPWWADIPYKGFEDIFFSPNFPKTDSPEYHSFLFFLWLDGTRIMSAEQLQSDAVAYFRGIATERGRNNDFTPDLSNVTAVYKEYSGGSRTFGGATARAFSGTLNIYDTHGKVIHLISEVLISTCGTPDHTVLFFGQSLEPRDGDMWKKIDAIRDTFQCGK